MFIQLATYSMYSFFFAKKCLKLIISDMPLDFYDDALCTFFSLSCHLKHFYNEFIGVLFSGKKFLIGVAYRYTNLEEICCFNNWSPLQPPLSCIVELLVNRFLLLAYIGPPERIDLWAWNSVGTFMGWLKHLALKCPDYFGPPVLIKSIGPHCSWPWGL